MFPRSCLVLTKTRLFAHVFPAPHDFQKQLDLWGQPGALAVRVQIPAAPYYEPV